MAILCCVGRNAQPFELQVGARVLAERDGGWQQMKQEFLKVGWCGFFF